mgnify:CR=1 FL=1
MVAVCIAANGKTVNPLQYGLQNARSGEDTYRILYQCHSDAVKMGASISYKGIDTLRMDIPRDFVPIPLTNDVDFAGVTIFVVNHQKDCSLFTLTEDLQQVDIKGYEIDNGDYRGNEVLKKGTFLLVVEDQEPWCGRKGYLSKVVRKDVMLIRNGKASNHPIYNYGTSASNPKGYYRQADTSKKKISNLVFNRTTESEFKTYCLSIFNLCKVELNNIIVNTPKDDVKFADKAIHIENCTDVKLNNIRINGTYSQERQYGYGISLFNISNLKVNRMFGRGNWGVFGAHCLNNVTLIDCDINRFDIHCYGRDVKAVNCKFTDLYNQLSSVYGPVKFERCTFTDFIPLLIESSYNAYTPFELIWKNCTFYLDQKHNYLLTLFGVPEPYNERPELRRKCLPNITVKNCRVVLADDVDNWYLIKTGEVKYKDSFDYITDITMKNVKVEGNRNAKFEMSTEPLKTTKQLKFVNGIRK